MRLDNFRLGKTYILASILAVLGASFVTWIEEGFIRSWSNTTSMYGPVVASFLGLPLLLGSLLPFSHLVRLRLAAIGSSVTVISILWFLIEIIPIATGNNDSGEVFWIVALPAILLFIYCISCYRKAESFIHAR